LERSSCGASFLSDPNYTLQGYQPIFHAGGAAYAKDAEGQVLKRGPILIGFVKKHYAVRFINGQYELFDEDENRVL
jgi:hypothetical protein